MKTKNHIIVFTVFIVVLYVTTSVMEWCSHYFWMHRNIPYVFEDPHYNTYHITHHKDTYLTQYNDGDEETMVFGLWTSHTMVITIVLLLIFSLLWYTIRTLQLIRYPLYILICLLIIFIYYWAWGSLHCQYHHRTVSLHNQIRYNLVPFFRPNTNSPIYHYLFKYHALHHLNKGESKGNYNILCPLMDHLCNTYTPRVDNRLYFSKHQPTTPQEEWLYRNQVFDIRIVPNNIIEYQLENTHQWNRFPYDV